MLAAPLAFVLAASVAAEPLAGAARDAAELTSVTFDAARCRPEGSGDAAVYSSDFRWDYTLPELIARFAEMYVSPKRLPRRAYWNDSARRFELPHLPERGGPVVLPASFVRSVARHIEDAFAADYVDAVFFPDMGHSHFLVPQARWDSTYAAYPTDRMSDMYGALMADPGLEMLYHTAEQLKTLDGNRRPIGDERTRFRYRTRNIVGGNDGRGGLKVLQNPGSAANTVHEVPGYFWWSAGFNVSANAAGCFTYTAKGRTFRFDLSLFDLAPAPGTGDFSTNAATAANHRFGDCGSLRDANRR